MSIRLIARKCLVSLYLIACIGCGDEAGPVAVEVVANPALVSRHAESITMELSATQPEPAIPSQASVISVHIGDEPIEFDEVEFLSPQSLRLRWVPRPNLRSGVKDIEIYLETNVDEFILRGRVEVM